MTVRNLSPTLDRFAAIGDLAVSVKKLLAGILRPLGLILFFETALLLLTANPGAKGFGMIALGSWLALSIWSQAGVGLPILPMIAVQNLIAYGLPIVVSNKTVMGYPEDFMTSAGMEVMLFSITMVVCWRVGMATLRLASPLCYVLQGFDEEGMQSLERLGFGLAIAATVCQVGQSLDWMDLIFQALPAGSSSIINAVVSGVGACGFFLVAIILGKGKMPLFKRLLFWAMLALVCFITAANFLLSSTATIIFSVLIGLFWSNGRVPWPFLLLVLVLLSFLNLGKFTMRERYWRLDEEDENVQEIKLADMPSHYKEWVEVSFDELIGNETIPLHPAFAEIANAESGSNSQSMLDRINNLQNLLYVMDAVQRQHITLMWGDTYMLIPPLLVPRILWPDKPRTHEGQVQLNVHFGRQALESSFQTYIAWGLLAEAYGNFGPIFGALLLGGVLGFCFAWVEKLVARKLLLSMEGFLSFTLFLSIANSFEMVSSVLITTIFQSFIPIVLASLPFVEHIVPRRPADG